MDTTGDRRIAQRFVEQRGIPYVGVTSGDPVARLDLESYASSKDAVDAAIASSISRNLPVIITGLQSSGGWPLRPGRVWTDDRLVQLSSKHLIPVRIGPTRVQRDQPKSEKDDGFTSSDTAVATARTAGTTLSSASLAVFGDPETETVYGERAEEMSMSELLKDLASPNPKVYAARVLLERSKSSQIPALLYWPSKQLPPCLKTSPTVFRNQTHFSALIFRNIFYLI